MDISMHRSMDGFMDSPMDISMGIHGYIKVGIFMDAFADRSMHVSMIHPDIWSHPTLTQVS